MTPDHGQLSQWWTVVPGLIEGSWRIVLADQKGQALEAQEGWVVAVCPRENVAKDIAAQHNEALRKAFGPRIAQALREDSPGP